MSNKQQTAVEWLIEQLRNNENIRWRGTRIIELAEKAKEMEKERKADTWNNAINAVEKDKWESFEQFYEQTYGGNNQLCCTPEGQIKRYVNCIGCDRKPLIEGGNK
jgi:hypothetical protein